MRYGKLGDRPRRNAAVPAAGGDRRGRLEADLAARADVAECRRVVDKASDRYRARWQVQGLNRPRPCGKVAGLPVPVRRLVDLPLEDDHRARPHVAAV